MEKEEEGVFPVWIDGNVEAVFGKGCSWSVRLGKNFERADVLIDGDLGAEV